jgi:hypothetical protein
MEATGARAKSSCPWDQVLVAQPPSARRIVLHVDVKDSKV